MVFVVVQEPSGDLPECGDRIRKRVHANIVSLEGFDEAARGWPARVLGMTGRLRFVKIGARAVGVIEDELDALIEELRRERDRRPRATCERRDAERLL